MSCLHTTKCTARRHFLLKRCLRKVFVCQVLQKKNMAVNYCRQMHIWKVRRPWSRIAAGQKSQSAFKTIEDESELMLCSLSVHTPFTWYATTKNPNVYRKKRNCELRMVYHAHCRLLSSYLTFPIKSSKHLRLNRQTKDHFNNIMEHEM